MSQSIFQQKLASLLKREISHYFLSKRDYSLRGIFVNATYAKVSADLSIARIHLSILSSEGSVSSFSPKEILKEIEAKKSECKKVVSQKLRNKFRRFPELYFYLDDTFEKIKQIEDALDEGQKSDLNLN